jgi:prolyl-tRNA editing enzyme YbaK/EbsC (Cys-tRNA(Pro) deacylase)
VPLTRASRFFAPLYGVAPERQLKTLVYVADGAPVVGVVRGAIVSPACTRLLSLT